MPIDIIQHGGDTYPKFQSEGFAAKYAIPFAKEVCKGRGVDVGPGRPEWMFPGAIPIDPKVSIADGVLPHPFHATNFPDGFDYLDYIFSSHCLEHLDRWVDVLDYWHTKLRRGGVLFLYLPDYSQSYWRPWSNRKHLSVFTPDIIQDYMMDKGYIKVMVSGVDLNNSFCAVGEK